MKDIKTGIIGCGNMGGAIARGMAGGGSFSPDSVLLFDKDEERMVSLAAETGCVKSGLRELVSASDILIIAVKPQDFKALAEEMRGDIGEATVVSVMAGVRISAVTGMIGSDLPAARAMPNMAAAVGEAVTCLSFNDKALLRGEIKDIFKSIGAVLEIEEKHMDAVTAISGSGPAYLFHLAEAMLEAALDSGIEEKAAVKLVEQTLYGSSLLLRSSEEGPAELIQKVASKGGTTEAAMLVFEEKLMKEIVKDAIREAERRSKQLSGG